jgi:hypothetical protein
MDEVSLPAKEKAQEPMGKHKTIIPFQATQTANGSGLPGPAEVVILFNSVVAFGPKALQNLDDNQYFIYSIIPSTNATGNGVTGQWSINGGVTWNEFYASTANEPIGDLTTTPTFRAEVYIGDFQDVRFLYTNGALAQATKFDVSMALDASSRSDSPL